MPFAFFGGMEGLVQFFISSYNHMGVVSVMGSNLPFAIEYLAIYIMNVIIMMKAVREEKH